MEEKKPLSKKEKKERCYEKGQERRKHQHNRKEKRKKSDS